MAKKKTFHWGGKVVSKSTYFRNRRWSAVKDSAAVESSKTDPSLPLTPHLNETEEALIRDFMVGYRSGHMIDDRFPVAIAPRLYRAIITLLDKIGY